jgi:hypothetical protein
MREEFYIRSFYKSLEDIEEILRTYTEYFNKFRQHMGFHALTTYEKLKGLPGSGNLPLDKISNFGTSKNMGTIIKYERCEITQFRAHLTFQT